MEIIFALPISAIVFTFAVAFLFFRTKSKPSLAMLAGCLLCWFSVGLGQWGPQKIKELPPLTPSEAQQSTGVVVRVMTIESPALPIGSMVSLGVVIFTIGFVCHVHQIKS